MQWADLIVFKGEQSDRVTVVTHELHFERDAIAVYQDNSAYVTPLETMLRQVARERYSIQFFDIVHRAVCIWQLHAMLNLQPARPSAP